MINDYSELIKFNIINSIINNNLINYNLFNNNIFIVVTLILYILFNYRNYILYEYIYKKPNNIIIEGTRNINFNRSYCRHDDLFSKTFKAISFYIHKNLNIFDLCSIKELSSEGAKFNDFGDLIQCNNSTNFSTYFVNQCVPFKLTKDIYCRVTFYSDSNNNEEKNNFQRESIKFDIFSYNLKTFEIKKFIDEITLNYEENLNISRKNKLYIYSLSIKKPDNNFRVTDNSNITWCENEFKSNKTFDKIFFSQKEYLLNKINFFINNENYYNKFGIPYTLGISLEGPPGTGKTSIIKCLANYLNRHIININLNKITTCEELNYIFFETTYNSNNNLNSINFKDKIYVFEDIDCCMGILKQRNENDYFENTVIQENIKEDLNDKYIEKSKIQNLFEDKDKLTLGHILNLFDGIKECPGRIIFLTSNYMNKIDSALKRPGRIDIQLKMDYVDIIQFKQFYNFYYKNQLQQNIEKKITNIFSNNNITPADLSNIFMMSEDHLEFINNIEYLYSSNK